MHCGVEHREKCVEHRRRDAGAAHRHAREAREHHRPHGIGREARPDADGTGPDRALLVRRELPRRDGAAGIRAERSRQPIDRFVGPRKPIDRLACLAHPFARGRAQRDHRAVAGHTYDVGQRDALAFENDHRRLGRRPIGALGAGG